MDVRTIAVLGAGAMGKGITYAVLTGGFRAILTDVQEGLLAEARVFAHETLISAKDRGKWFGDPDHAMEALTTTQNFDDLAEADLVIEAVPEDIKLKLDLFGRLDSLVRPEAILATNTSSLSVTEMSAATKHPKRFLGMHFFNPVHKMKLIELVLTSDTSEETIQTAEAVSKQMGKETVRVKDGPGFATSRINALIGCEAFRMWEEGIATPEDIDKAIKLGLNHPMGPFEMIDLVGLDVRLGVLKYLSKKLGKRFQPSAKHIELVEKGRLGRKTGKGVYDYPAK